MAGTVNAKAVTRTMNRPFQDLPFVSTMSESAIVYPRYAPCCVSRSWSFLTSTLRGWHFESTASPAAAPAACPVTRQGPIRRV